MGQVAVVIGQAGTGKTEWLMDKAIEFGPQLITAGHQQMLVITRMHGARRRLQLRLADTGRRIPYTLATIDGFALSIVSRWRSALGHSRPVVAVPGDCNFDDGILGIEAYFGRIVDAAARLLRSPTVGGVIGATYPLVLIDEFQDCHGPLLDFVVTLSKHSSVLLAADDFQLLDSAVSGCPAVEWARAQAVRGDGTIRELTECHRTTNTGILDAARALRDKTPTTGATIPVISCPKYQVAAWKIIERLVCCPASSRWIGTCALICPTHDPLLEKVMEWCKAWLQQRGRSPIRWQVESSAQHEQKRVAASLGLKTTGADSDSVWSVPASPLDGMGTHILNRLQRFVRLRGINAIPPQLVARHVDIAVHEQHAYCAPASNRTVTTVHGAKNREFDNVFVLWNPFSVKKWNVDDQRRLLYNAVTRSKTNCVILVLGTEKSINSDPVLSLLGPPEPAFSPRAKMAKRNTKKDMR